MTRKYIARKYYKLIMPPPPIINDYEIFRSSEHYPYPPSAKIPMEEISEEEYLEMMKGNINDRT